MTTCAHCNRGYEPRQAWIHNPCRYMDDVTPNHVKEEQRGPISVTRYVTEGSGVTENVTDGEKNVTPEGENVTVVTEVVTEVLTNAERQKRYRERLKEKKPLGIPYG